MFLFVKQPEHVIRYAAIMVLAYSGGHVLNFFYTQKYVPLRVTKKLNVKRHLKPILYLLGVNIAIQIYVRSDIVILGLFCTDSEVGIYTLSSKIYSIIKSLLNAIIMVILPRISNYIGDCNRREYSKLISKLRNVLYVIVIPCATGLFMESENILRLIGGSESVLGNMAVRILCFALVFAVFGYFYAQGILVPNSKDRVFFMATIGSAAINIILNVIIVPYWGMNGAAITTVFAEIVVLLVCCMNSKEVYIEKNAAILFSVIGGCVLICVCCMIVNALEIVYYYKLIISVFLSSMIYFLFLIAVKNEVIKELLANKGFKRFL